MKYPFIKKKTSKLILNNISPFLINNIVAPHGITDVSHSLETRQVGKLLGINFFSYTFIDICSKINHDDISNLLFLLLSAFHFRHDFILVKNKMILSSIFVLSIIFLYQFIGFTFSLNYFIFYMSLVHVPNHYKNNWWHIKKRPLLNLILIISIAYVSNILYYTYTLRYNIFFFNFIKSIIISHVIYNK